jgi:transposase
LKAENDDDLLFGDEARFGNNSKLGYGWFKKGTRPRVKIKIGYLSFYIYAAISIKTGEHFAAQFPDVDTACMNGFLKDLSENYVEKKIALIIDGAGWHKSKKLKIPENIDIFLLPPYSPELNPAERLWEHVKKNTLYNRLFETLKHLEYAVEAFMRSLQKSTILQLCNLTYLTI